MSSSALWLTLMVWVCVIFLSIVPGARNLMVSIRALNNESMTNDETMLYYRLIVGNCFSCASGTGLNWPSVVVMVTN